MKTAEGGKKRVYMLFDLNPPAKFDFNPEKMAYLTQKARGFIESKVPQSRSLCAICVCVCVCP